MNRIASVKLNIVSPLEFKDIILAKKLLQVGIIALLALLELRVVRCPLRLKNVVCPPFSILPFKMLLAA